ncbi:hypothetical protein ABK040_007635 [Willaertia magna]
MINDHASDDIGHLSEEQQLELKLLSPTFLAEFKIPTLDIDVRIKLRELSEPITLFGEEAPERRERLKRLFALQKLRKEQQQYDQQPIQQPRNLQNLQGFQQMKDEEEEEEDESKEEEEQDIRKEYFLVESENEELYQKRYQIAQFSLSHSQQRLIQIKELLNNFNSNSLIKNNLIFKKENLFKKLINFQFQSSLIGDKRPISNIKLLDSNRCVIGGWSGNLKVFNNLLNNNNLQNTLQNNNLEIDILAHQERITNLAIRNEYILSSSADKTIKMWHFENSNIENNIDNNTDFTINDTVDNDYNNNQMNDDNNNNKIQNKQIKKEPLFTFEVKTIPNKLSIHPNGEFFISTNMDHTFTLFDITTSKILYHQEGHYSPVYGIDHHPDGSIIGTTDLNGLCKIWDLRSGKCISNLLHHLKGILTCNFHPFNGFSFLTSGCDGLIDIWDLRFIKQCSTIPPKRDLNNNNYILDDTYRQQLPLYSILASTNNIHTCIFEPLYGRFIMSSGFDGKIRFWDNVSFKLISELEVGSKIMCSDIIHDGEEDFVLVSSDYDRKWRLWNTKMI